MTAADQSLFDKIWADHVVARDADGQCLIHIDRHILHEASTPLAFDGLRRGGRRVQRPEATLGVVDHTIPTIAERRSNLEPKSREMMEAFRGDADEFGIRIFDEHDPQQGIVHVVGPEQGFTLPGTVLVCGDSHTSTHGAFGAYAFGVGSTEIEHVFATGALWRQKPANMLVRVEGALGPDVHAKDVILAIIGLIGVAGGRGHVIEFAGSAIRALSMEGRMTLCNMAIEAGANAGLIAPDETTFAYLEGRPYAPIGDDWAVALRHWRTLASDPAATFDRVVTIDAAGLKPMISWGTTPQDVIPFDGQTPYPADEPDPTRRAAMQRALDYMGLAPGTPIAEVAVDYVFIGSCTNARIEDLRVAAAVLAGRRIAPHVTAIAVPGSGLVKRQAESEGLDHIFRAAGFEWREPGCSMCLAMNGDSIGPGVRCASTSNRNFEGRQGRGGRTHLMSPATAASAAITGRLARIANEGGPA
jgi:3-isopropylmalate/(R)-2-methylmalate dehydratase large subunit